MKQFLKSLSIITFLALVMTSLTSNKVSNLTIRIENIQQQDGTISIIIFKSDDGWPNEYKKAYFAKGTPANSSVVVQQIKGIPYGTYAVAVLHDINDNKIADKSIIGIPQEPFGFSNYPKISFGVPDFKDVSFQVNAPNQEIVIKMMEI